MVLSPPSRPQAAVRMACSPRLFSPFPSLGIISLLKKKKTKKLHLSLSFKQWYVDLTYNEQPIF